MNPKQDPSPAHEQATELAALSGLHALDSEQAAAMAHCQSCPLGQAFRASWGFDESVAQMTASHYPPVAPSPDLKNKIFAAIGQEIPSPTQPSAQENEEPPEGGYHFIGHDEGEWQSLPGEKIRLKTLSDLPEAAHTTILLEADPGAEFLPHAHEGMEEILLLSGDLTTLGRRLQPGDYLRHEPNTLHAKAVSEHGCRALLITARENHPRRAISAYNELKNLLKGLTQKS
ncbi:cupin domain-containing protein [Roseibacillus ishigakijimensis]|uniref:Cupin domain-containing protein n=1 Tax=Roseibacillus ishigakijimensis TaxID=454146 RepID=A0A934VLC2_9BACT|nr:cupin domain-containing protein [Roseibacillus ishigakijimensis]MBK1834529.1 cupin domain-containing protein [Roseibacillus ishigakijimensis]